MGGYKAVSHGMPVWVRPSDGATSVAGVPEAGREGSRISRGEGEQVCLPLPHELPDGSYAGVLRWFWSAPRFAEYPEPGPVEVRKGNEEFQDERIGGCVATLRLGDREWETAFEARWCRACLQQRCVAWANGIIAEECKALSGAGRAK
jgi:hypothetical protein